MQAKMGQAALLVALIMVLGVFLIGCGETTPSNPTLNTKPSPTAITNTSPAITTSVPAATTTNSPFTPIVTVPPVSASTTAVTSVTVAATTTPIFTAAPATTVASVATTSIATAQTSAATTVPTPAPVINASGKLAYVESGNLYIYDFSSQSKKMLYQSTGTSGIIGTPVWSPDNTRLLIVLRDDMNNPNSRSNLYIVRLIGGEPQLITPSSTTQSCEEDPAWSPDGKQIAFTEVLDAAHNNSFGSTNPREIWTVDANAQNPHKIADGLEASWSGDSSQLAYVTNGGLKAGDSFRQNNALHLVKIGTNGPSNDNEILNIAKIPNDLNKYGIPFGASTLALHTPIFYNNDKTLAVVTQGYTGLILTISSTGTDLKIWDAQPEGSFGRIYANPNKNSRLMYEANPPSGVSQVYITDTSAAPLPVRVEKVSLGGIKIKENASNPSWSANGNQVAYLYQNIDGSTSKGPNALAIATSQATQPQTLVRGNLTGLAWSH